MGIHARRSSHLFQFSRAEGSVGRWSSGLSRERFPDQNPNVIYTSIYIYTYIYIHIHIYIIHICIYVWSPPPRTPLSSFQCSCCINIAFHHVFLEMLPANALHEINILRLFGEGPFEKKNFWKNTKTQKNSILRLFGEDPLKKSKQLLEKTKKKTYSKILGLPPPYPGPLENCVIFFRGFVAQDLWILFGFLEVFLAQLWFHLPLQCVHCCSFAVLPFLLWLIGALAPELVANDIHVCFIIDFCKNRENKKTSFDSKPDMLSKVVFFVFLVLFEFFGFLWFVYCFIWLPFVSLCLRTLSVLGSQTLIKVSHSRACALYETKLGIGCAVMFMHLKISCCSAFLLYCLSLGTSVQILESWNLGFVHTRSCLGLTYSNKVYNI